MITLRCAEARAHCADLLLFKKQEIQSSVLPLRTRNSRFSHLTLAETARLGSAEVSLRFRDVQLALDGSDVGENDAGLAGPTVQARGCALKRRLDARCSSWSLLCDRHEGARRGVIAEVLSGGRYA